MTWPRGPGRRLWLAGLGACLIVAGVLSRFASEAPDGLERVAQDQGIAGHAVERTGLLSAADPAGVLLGVGIVLVSASLLAWSLGRRGTSPEG